MDIRNWTLGVGHSIAIAALLSAATAMAGPILEDPEGWSNAPSLAGWTNALPIGTEDTTLSNPGTGGAEGAGDGYLRITFEDQGFGPPSYEDDIIYTTSTNETGLFPQQYLHLRFQYYAEDTNAQSTVIYMHSAVSDSIWEYAFTSTAVGEWTWFDVPFYYSLGWAGPGGASDFLTDLANVDWIGLSIIRNLTTDQQDYGLDNWEYYLNIPEPGTTCVLASALLSLAVVYRKRRKVLAPGADET